jgi:putative transposase
MGEEGTLMKRRRHTPEQVIRKLREAERLLGEGKGKTIPEAAKELGISEQTYHRWRNQYGGMKANDAKRLKDLERENQQLKRIVADQVLENQALKEINRGNWEARPVGGRRSRYSATAFAAESRLSLAARLACSRADEPHTEHADSPAPPLARRP